jgi:hypothetical protein
MVGIDGPINLNVSSLVMVPGPVLPTNLLPNDNECRVIADQGDRPSLWRSLGRLTRDHYNYVVPGRNMLSVNRQQLGCSIYESLTLNHVRDYETVPSQSRSLWDWLKSVAATLSGSRPHGTWKCQGPETLAKALSRGYVKQVYHSTSMCHINSSLPHWQAAHWLLAA